MLPFMQQLPLLSEFAAVHLSSNIDRICHSLVLRGDHHLAKCLNQGLLLSLRKGSAKVIIGIGFGRARRQIPAALLTAFGHESGQ
jgi:hypothetical protein